MCFSDSRVGDISINTLKKSSKTYYDLIDCDLINVFNFLRSKASRLSKGDAR